MVNAFGAIGTWISDILSSGNNKISFKFDYLLIVNIDDHFSIVLDLLPENGKELLKHYFRFSLEISFCLVWLSYTIQLPNKHNKHKLLKD